MQDRHEFVATMKWFVGIGPRPKYGRWTYWEKFDYFAVFWGIVVIGSTGLTLWFPVFFTRFLPGSFINRGHHHPQRRSSTGHRLHLYRAFFQHPSAAGEVSHGHHHFHRPYAVGRIEARQASGVCRTRLPPANWNSAWRNHSLPLWLRRSACLRGLRSGTGFGVVDLDSLCDALCIPIGNWRTVP